MEEAAKSAEGEVTRIPANWKPEDTRRFNEALREELSKERAILTNIELMINDITKLRTWKERKEIPHKERLIKELVKGRRELIKGITRKLSW